MEANVSRHDRAWFTEVKNDTLLYSFENNYFNTALQTKMLILKLTVYKNVNFNIMTEAFKSLLYTLFTFIIQT